MSSNRPVFAHWLLLTAALFEVFELQAVPAGMIHHVADAVTILAFAVGSALVSRRPRAGVEVALLGAVPWTLDLAKIGLVGIDVESAFWVALHFLVGWRLYKRVIGTSVVLSHELIDAVTVFIVAALGFANLYGIALSLDPGALVDSRLSPGATIPYEHVLYFSFETQLTVGFGDISPGTKVSRMIAIAQSLFGVLYVAILVAKLVSARMSGSGSPPPNDVHGDGDA
ncbi:MAG: two pore domain potassium channel family protein [Armatimonadetes bacterium]|nr:two pore domain potassium channel family protein [Armatimonadota bacterium]